MDGRGSKVAVREAWRLLWVLCVLLCAVEPVGAQPQKVYDINLPAQTLADGLNGLSEQTGVPVLFPFDLVKDRTAPAVVGHYGVFEALEALLKGSGLSGDLSEKGVLTVFASDSGANRHRETILNQHDTTKNSNDGPIQKHGRLATFFAALGTAFSASAQTVGNDTAPVADVVITAQKHEERLQDVPVPVTVLNSEELTGNNQVLLRDYASSVPGFNVTPNYVATQNLSIRGVTTGGSSTPTVGVTIDDVPFGASAGPHANHVPDVDPGDLARIEVLRGPQGTLYGADSMGGLLKFVTLDPSSKEYSGRIEAGTSDVYHGAEPGYDMRAAANVPVTDSFAMRISAFRRQDPGYIDNPTLHINGVNEDTADGGRFSALWRASESFSVKLSALYQEIEANGLDEVDTPTAAFPPTLGLRGLQQSSIQGVGAQHTAIQAYSATVKAHFSGVDLTSLTGYNVVKESDSLDWGFAFGAPVLSAFGVSGTGYFEADDFNKVTQEIRLEGSFWDRFSWLLGGFYTHENDQGHFNAAAVDTANGQIVGWFWNKFQEVPDRFQEYAPFADLTYKFSDQFDLQVGARESYIERTLQQTFQTGPYTVQVLHKPEPVISPPTAYKDRALTYLATP
ncbi:MAG TPA: TonB-dependent receptor plug domain-containing protein, partial [Steroidobacteraceae bacterium]